MSADVSVPQHCPSPAELDDLELIGHGLLGGRFGVPGDLAQLVVPADIAETAGRAGALELVDPEGLPLARVRIESSYDVAAEDSRGLAGLVEALAHHEFGPYRRLYLGPTTIRDDPAPHVTVPVDRALTETDLRTLHDLDRPVRLLALVGTATPRGLSPIGLLRATLAAARDLPEAVTVAVPLARTSDPGRDEARRAHVLAAYTTGEPGDLVELGEPRGALPAPVDEAVRHDRPAPGEQGLVVFFTGLSGSGKSTLARALHDVILEGGRRTVTSLDGDVVRRHLSAGLGFSAADRETNIRRIGWVAAEIGRHGGVAVCSPIAPFARTRAQVRQMAEDAGAAFVLVHVATPLAECERRDRKGLYARARRGEIPEFTGISSPYDEPLDAAVRVDTTGRSIEDALDDVLTVLREGGHLP